MKVIFLDDELTISLIPRIIPSSGENFMLSLRNEMTDLVITPDFSFTISDKVDIFITTLPEDFKTQNKYEITLTNDGEVIYLGKLIVLESGTDIQNYTYGSQTTSKFGFQ